IAEHWRGWLAYGLHGLVSPGFGLLLAGLVVAWYCYLIDTRVPEALSKRFSGLYTLLVNKYYDDWFNEQVVARGTRALGRGLWQGGDRGVIDGIVNGSARLIGWTASVGRLMQSGFIYHYAFAMIIGIMALLTFFVLTVH
ncbi:MAG TPA: NADH-quinone oxidoreductase subunit L, partial [Burkholderiaceae bacterium]|nr:NADH-quinone oxidoreductase subunit L [Burkholderiaceae bacterium]